MRSQASSVGAIGFSSSTWRPAANASSATGSCRWWGTMTSTALKPPAATASASDPNGRAPVSDLGGHRRARPGSGSITAVTSMRGRRALIACRCHSAIAPHPTNASPSEPLAVIVPALVLRTGPLGPRSASPSAAAGLTASLMPPPRRRTARCTRRSGRAPRARPGRSRRACSRCAPCLPFGCAPGASCISASRVGAERVAEVPVDPGDGVDRVARRGRGSARPRTGRRRAGRGVRPVGRPSCRARRPTAARSSRRSPRSTASPAAT